MERDQKLETYLGFSLKSNTIYTGMKLEEKLEKGKINALIILPSCQEKDRKRYADIKERQTNLTLFSYDGDINIPLILGYERLKAFDIQNRSLAKAVVDRLQELTKEEQR